MKKYVKFVRAVLSVIVVAGVVTGISFGISGASAQEQSLEGLVFKLNRLERDIQTLNRQVYKGATPPKSSIQGTASKGAIVPSGGSAYVRLEERLSQLESELQNTTNVLESMNHGLDVMTGRLDKLVSDIDFRLSRLEGGAVQSGSVPVGPPSLSAVPKIPGVQQIGPSTGGAVVSSLPGARQPGSLGQISETDLSATQREVKNAPQTGTVQAPAIAPQSILPKGTPTVQYKHAFSILRKTDYDTAELAFKEFIQKHPKDKLTPNARYWLGKTYYVRNNYRDAAEAFFRGYQQAPKGQKAPDTLLMLGMSLTQLKKKSDACATFSKLAKDYPNASSNIKKQLKRERGRSGCK